MMANMSFSIEHVRPPRPLQFASTDPEWDMGQSTRHLKLCVFLWDVLRRIVGREGTVGADNFVYFDGANDGRKCAPDAFVKLRVPDHDFDAWKTWEKGTPELCVEILSPSDTKEPLPLAEKLSRFHSMGVREVVCLDVDAPEGSRLRAWDRIEGDLVERVVHRERTPCLTLGRWFVVAPLGDQPVALAVAEDEAGNGIVLPAADALADAERKRDDAERKRDDAERERDALKAQVAELEAALGRRT